MEEAGLGLRGVVAVGAVAAAALTSCGAGSRGFEPMTDERAARLLNQGGLGSTATEAAAIVAQGADAWFESPPERFLGNKYKAQDFEQVRDILDVWFDSGSTHAFTLEGSADLKWPADLYLEGSDQHRGWFHSSLLESCGTRGRAPYDGVLTHGFTLDEQGRKMSKSLGNITAPQVVCDQYGADILRLWVVGTDYTEDQRIGPEILKHQAEAYRRLRNTLRYLLGSLDGYSAAEKVEPKDMPELERWVLHRLSELDAMFRPAVDDFDFHRIATELHNFCAVDLSAFYFDIRKDAIYCDAPSTPRRRAARKTRIFVLNSFEINRYRQSFRRKPL